ncbi:MAG: hypothetical protein U9R29_08360 [Thermodesulfobacteriota bacterium]|nr:hypothetical protein [Thermodesulfobacteriota bacterium]
MIEGIGNSSLESFKVEARRLLENSVQQQQQTQTTDNEKLQDRVTLGNQPIDAGTYCAAVSDADLGTTFTMLRDLFAANLKEQGVATTIATGNSDIDLESLTPEEATQLVADDGYFGIENTAQRIFDFATGIAGNDPSRLDAIISGINDGFAQAEQAWGGTLPEISYQTQDALGTMLEEWSGQEIDFG